MMPLSHATNVYVDEYIPRTATLEVLVGEVIKKIRGNPRLHSLFFVELEHHLTLEDKLVYARSFLREIEVWRTWVDKYLWWMNPEE